MAERTTVRLPSDLIVRAKLKAAAEGRTLTSLIEEGLRSVVSEKRNFTPPRRVMPRLSEAQGWLKPPYDVKGLAGLQEDEDIEYIERLNKL